MILKAPQLAARSCDDCEKFWWDEKTLQVRRDQVTRKPIPRPAHMKTPCSTCPKVPQSVRDSIHPAGISRADAVELTERNTQVYRHHLECRAVNDWPRREDGRVDPLVKRHAQLIEDLEAGHKQRQLLDRVDQALTLVSLLG